MENPSLICLLASYAFAFVLELIRIWYSKRWLQLGAVVVTIAGFVAHTWYLLSRATQFQIPPLLSSSHDWFLVTAWLLVVSSFIYSFLWSQSPGKSSLGLFVLPVTIILACTAAFLNNRPAEGFEPNRFWTILHAGSLSIGIVGVSIGFLSSLMYLLQHRRLKKKRQLSPGFSLPALTTLAKYNYRAVLLSFPMLTIGLLSGLKMVIAPIRENPKFSWGDPIVLGFCVVWSAMFSLFIWMSRRKSGYGRQVAMMTAWALGFLIVTLIGLQVLVSLAGIDSHNI